MVKAKSFLFLRIMAILFLLLTLVFPACSKTDKEFSKEDTGQQTSSLLIEGMGQSKEISADNLAGIESVEISAHTINSANEEATYQVKGILLEKVLDKYMNISLDDVNSIKLVAGDGYAIEVSSDIIKNRKIILAYEINGEPLEENDQPFRSVIPDERSMYWVKNLVKIVLIEKREIKNISSIIFIDTHIKNLEQSEYQYYESKDHAIKAVDLLMDFRKSDLQDFIILKSSDGLEKTEDIEIFKEAYIKIDGDDSPAFLSQDLPKGMWVKDILMVLYGQTAYFSAQEAFNIFENKIINEIAGISIDEILLESSITDSGQYLLRAIDGYNIEIDKDSLKKGILYLDQELDLAIYFENLPEKYSIKNLLSIESIN